MITIGLNIICEAESPNYVLRRGLVSDNNQTAGIVLRNCGITRIEKDAFNALPSLEELDLSQNNIKEFSRVFRQSPNLKKLNLSGSFIEQIKLNAFDRLTKLNSLDLSNNLIMGKNLDSHTFDHCRSIEYLDLGGNVMTGTSDHLLHALETIKTLILRRCSLQAVPGFATRSNLNTMTQLALSFNQITRLHDPKTFAELVKLEYLELGGNLIDFVHEDIFKPMKSIRAISLHHNKISRLPENLFTDLNKLININLSNNLIEYVPVNAFRRTSVKNLNLAGNRFTYLQDNFCLELRNSGARLQKFFFNQNPWQCACLNEVLKEVKNIGIEYNSIKFKGKEPVCVTSKEFQCKRQMNINDEYLEMYNNLVKNHVKQLLISTHDIIFLQPAILRRTPETGAVFTFGKSHFADNEPSHFFIKKNGRVFVFGGNAWGQLGLGHKDEVTRPSCVKWLKPHRAMFVACGRAHTVFVTDSNSVYSVGCNDEGQLGTGDMEHHTVPQYVEVEEHPNIRQVSAGSNHTALLTDEGRVFVCGSNTEGQLGLGEDTRASTSDNENQKLGIPSTATTIYVPEVLPLDIPIKSACCGAAHTFLLSMDETKILAFGSNERGQLGLPQDVENMTQPMEIDMEKMFDGYQLKLVACGAMHTAFVTDNGLLYTCGESRHNKLCLEDNDDNSNETNQYSPKRVTAMNGFIVDNVACGGCHTLLTATKGSNADFTNNDFNLVTEETRQISLTELPPLKIPVKVDEHTMEDITNSNVHANVDNINGNADETGSIDSLEANVSGSHIVNINDLENDNGSTHGVEDLKDELDSTAPVLKTEVMEVIETMDTMVDHATEKIEGHVKETTADITKAANAAFEAATDTAHQKIEVVEDVIKKTEAKIAPGIDEVKKVLQIPDKIAEVANSPPPKSPILQELLHIPDLTQMSPNLSKHSDDGQKSENGQSENETIPCGSDKSSPQAGKVAKTQAVLPIVRSEDHIDNEEHNEESDVVVNKMDDKGRFARIFQNIRDKENSCMGKGKVIEEHVVENIHKGLDTAEESVHKVEETALNAFLGKSESPILPRNSCWTAIMSVQTLLLDFSIDPARLGDESGQKAVFSQLETVLKDYVPNLILAAEVAVDGGSLKLLTGKKGTTVSVRLFDRGLVTVNIEYYKEESEEPLISFKSARVLESQVKKYISVTKSQAYAPIKRGLFSRYYPTSDERLLEYDIDNVVFDEQSPFQRVQIVHSKSLGNMLVLDDLQKNFKIQTIFLIDESKTLPLRRSERFSLERRRQLRVATGAAASSSSGSEGDASPPRASHTHQQKVHNRALFTFKQVRMICERMLREQEAALRAEYETALSSKLAEQYEAFLASPLTNDLVINFTVQRRPPPTTCMPHGMDAEHHMHQDLVPSCKQGFKEAALKFQQEAGLQEPALCSSLDERIMIREAVQNGRIPDAIAMLIRGGRAEEALSFASAALAEAGAADRTALTELERSLALLAFPDPHASPFADLLLPSHSQKIASELNAAILKMENQEYTNPKLCSLLRMILWSQNELDKHNIKYPKMTDLANATIEQPKL
ncbi:hypothetical protein MSG28_007770 [Choristoneura fumiferana]|uniref:Uncharacterized protein n=1 Tax=Choristoneura fumiferana TaxID=7141 RepID=A0ACC0JZ32_CHOFU|nr:hypothetical protein MSG28_007770 [Choristoneura fumiferana]